jgi:RNA polymerase sigma factor (sigma-70 family)
MYPKTAKDSDVDNLRRAVSSSKVLAPEEEQQLAIAAQAGDALAFDRLVRAHLRLVFAMASEYRSFGVPIEDLTSEGLLALVTAARRFDPERGSRLAVYAAHWIRARLRRFTLHNRRMVGPPSTRRGRLLIGRLHRAEHELTQAFGEPPDRDAIATYVGMLPQDVEAVELALRARDVSVSDGEQHEPGTVAPISSDTSPEAIVKRSSDKRRLKLHSRAASQL